MRARGEEAGNLRVRMLARLETAVELHDRALTEDQRRVALLGARQPWRRQLVRRGDGSIDDPSHPHPFQRRPSSHRLTQRAEEPGILEPINQLVPLTPGS